MQNALRILLVEDDIEDAGLTLRFFRKNNIPNLLHATSADEASDVLQKLTISELLPRIMLVDLGLPGIKGIDLIRKVKVDDKFKNIKIVVLTGSRSLTRISLIRLSFVLTHISLSLLIFSSLRKY